MRATATRLCPDCGDRRVMRVTSIRANNGYGKWARPGSTVTRRCVQCNMRVNMWRGGGIRVDRDNIDHVVVTRLLDRRPVRSNIAERQAAARLLLETYREPVAKVAERLGVSTRTIHRYQTEWRAAA